jgi:hypothetical protein
MISAGKIARLWSSIASTAMRDDLRRLHMRGVQPVQEKKLPYPLPRYR